MASTPDITGNLTDIDEVDGRVRAEYEIPALTAMGAKNRAKLNERAKGRDDVTIVKVEKSQGRSGANPPKYTVIADSAR